MFVDGHLPVQTDLDPDVEDQSSLRHDVVWQVVGAGQIKLDVLVLEPLLQGELFRATVEEQKFSQVLGDVSKLRDNLEFDRGWLVGHLWLLLLNIDVHEGHQAFLALIQPLALPWRLKRVKTGKSLISDLQVCSITHPLVLLGS